MTKKPYGRTAQRQIDGKKLAYVMCEKCIDINDLTEAIDGPHFRRQTWLKMLRGMAPRPEVWTKLCNLLEVPIDHFDLKPEPVAVESASAEDVLSDMVLRAVDMGDHDTAILALPLLKHLRRKSA